MEKNLKHKILINNIVIAWLMTTNIYAMEKPMLKPAEAHLKVIVSTLKVAHVHLLLEAEANILDLKEKVSLYDPMSTNNSCVYLVKTKLGIFEKKSDAIADIQKLKDVIDYYKTNKFLICLAPPKKVSFSSL